MKHPLFTEIFEQEDSQFLITLCKGTEEDGYKCEDKYTAKNAEELLVFLMGVYDWYPEEIEWDEELRYPPWGGEK